MTGPGPFPVPASVPLRRLRKRSNARTGRSLLAGIVTWAPLAGVGAALAVGAARALGHLLTQAGTTAAGVPGHLFALAALLLLLGSVAQLLRSAGPVTVGSAFWFWLLSAPVRRRDLLRRRYWALLAVTAILVGAVTVLAAHSGSVAVLPVVATAVLSSLALAAGAVCGQAWEIAGHLGHAVSHLMRGAGLLAFGSIATGAGRAGLDSALRIPPGVELGLLSLLAVTAAACVTGGYRALDWIDVSRLRRGQGLWMAGQAAAASMDVFLLSEFLADQHARRVSRVRMARIHGSFAAAIARSEWARLRRRPGLAVRAAAAAVTWWGCRPVIGGAVSTALAVILGYCLVLPLAATLRQLAASPELRAQFAPRDHWLSAASLGVCALASAAWTVVVAPGLGGGPALAALMIAGLTAAVYRTVTRPPLDYSGPLVSTPLGDYPLDLWRQIFRGPLLLAVLMVAAIAVTA